MRFAHLATKILATALLGLCSFASVVAAQDTTSRLPRVDEQWLNTQRSALAALDPAMVRDIRQILEMRQAKKVVLLMVTPLLPRIRAEIINGMPPATADRERIADAFLQKLEARLQSDELIDLVVPLYAKYLTHDDVRALLAFYATPAGQHWLEQEPSIARESQTFGSQYMTNVVGPLIVRELANEFGPLRSERSQ